MAKVYLVFQKENLTAVTRFRDYLSKHGWQKVSTGVYLNLVDDSFDEKALWNFVQDKFALIKNGISSQFFEMRNRLFR